MKVVKVYGALKERLGQSRFEFNVNTPAEAIRGLCANFEGLDKWIIDSEKDGIGYKVMIGTEQITEDNIDYLNKPWSPKEEFSITPVISGSGRGWGQILLGAILIGASFITFGASAAFAGGTGAGLSGGAMYAAGAWGSKALGMLGLSMVLGGVSTLLTPVPPRRGDSQKNESFGFGGVGNNVSQGLPVPICYGRLFVGSSAISVGLDTDEQI